MSFYHFCLLFQLLINFFTLHHDFQQAPCEKSVPSQLHQITDDSCFDCHLRVKRMLVDTHAHWSTNTVVLKSGILTLQSSIRLIAWPRITTSVDRRLLRITETTKWYTNKRFTDCIFTRNLFSFFSFMNVQLVGFYVGAAKKVLGKCGKQWRMSKRMAYFNFFFGRKLLVCPHFVLRQLVARGCKRA